MVFVVVVFVVVEFTVVVFVVIVFVVVVFIVIDAGCARQNISVAVRSYLSEAHWSSFALCLLSFCLLSLYLLLLSPLSLAQGAPARREYIGSGQVTFE